MKITNKTILYAVVLSTLTACGSSSDNSGPVLVDDNLPEPDACDTDYHETIVGTYSGQLNYQGSERFDGGEVQSCQWDITLSMNPVADSGTCDIDFHLSSELLSATADCVDLETAGEAYSTSPVQTDAVAWPVEISFLTSESLGVMLRYPTATTNNNGLFKFVFDGRGNIGLTDTSGFSGYTGALVLFSDQPFETDDGMTLQGLGNLD